MNQRIIMNYTYFLFYILISLVALNHSPVFAQSTSPRKPKSLPNKVINRSPQSEDSVTDTSLVKNKLQKSKARIKTKVSTKKKSKAFKNYKELHLSYGFMTDGFTLVEAGNIDQLRALLQSLNLTYVLQVPSRNPNYVFNYGFGLGYGTLTGRAESFNEEVKNKSWFNLQFTPGLDFRADYRNRLGLTLPIGFRFIDFGFQDNTKVRENELFSIGLGGRYVHTVTKNDAFAFSITHYFNWKSSVWHFNWQRRLGP